MAVLVVPVLCATLLVGERLLERTNRLLLRHVRHGLEDLRWHKRAQDVSGEREATVPWQVPAGSEGAP